MSYILHRPATVAEAIALQKETDGAYLAGGTVTLVNAHKRREIAQHQIALENIAALRGIREENGVLLIGANTTMTELEENALVKEKAFALWQAAWELGGPQIRNRATLGGNLASASPSSDCATPLLAMDAGLHVMGAAGERVIPVREFFLGRFRHVLKADEIIVSVGIPACDSSAFRKVGKRAALSVSCINMAGVRRGGMTDIAVGAAAPAAVYCKKTSEILTNDISAVAAAQEAVQTEISPIDDRWATASYRRTVCGNLLTALLNETEA